jgi:hypothetical protein
MVVCGAIALYESEMMAVETLGCGPLLKFWPSAEANPR